MSRQRWLRFGEGVHFAERLSGTLHSATEAPLPLALRLDIELPGWRRFVSDPARALRVTGSADVGAGGETASVDGELQPFPRGRLGGERYLLTLTGPNTPRQLVGVKTQRPGRPLAVWAHLTELSVRRPVSGRPPTLCWQRHRVSACGCTA